MLKWSQLGEFSDMLKHSQFPRLIHHIFKTILLNQRHHGEDLSHEIAKSLYGLLTSDSASHDCKSYICNETNNIQKYLMSCLQQTETAQNVSFQISQFIVQFMMQDALPGMQKFDLFVQLLWETVRGDNTDLLTILRFV